jgi:hypothetical protein
LTIKVTHSPDGGNEPPVECLKADLRYEVLVDFGYEDAAHLFQNITVDDAFVEGVDPADIFFPILPERTRIAMDALPECVEIETNIAGLFHASCSHTSFTINREFTLRVSKLRFKVYWKLFCSQSE